MPFSKNVNSSPRTPKWGAFAKNSPLGSAAFPVGRYVIFYEPASKSPGSFMVPATFRCFSDAGEARRPYGQSRKRGCGCGSADGPEVPRDRPGVHPPQDSMSAVKVDHKPTLSLQLSFRPLRKLPGRLLKGSKRNSAPPRHKTQVSIAEERSLVTKLTQEVAHTRMVLQIPRRQIRR